MAQFFSYNEKVIFEMLKKIKPDAFISNNLVCRNTLMCVVPVGIVCTFISYDVITKSFPQLLL